MPIVRQLFSGVLLASMLFSSGCTEERIAFKKLHRVRRDQDAARPLAETLMKTEQGVQLALDDFDCFGGTTRGWSSWIIEHTPITNVNERLDSIMGDPAFEESKRISAAWLLWRRTDEDRYLEELFTLVREPGSKPVEMGRNWLASTSTNAVMWSQFNVPASQPLTMTTNQFSDAMRAGIIGFRP